MEEVAGNAVGLAAEVVVEEVIVGVAAEVVVDVA